VNASYIDLGSPHVVIKVGDLLKNPAEPYSFYSNLNELPVFELGSKIRHLPYFAPEGVNVNFIDLTDGKIFIRTFERGVENETLACGSGSVSAAIISFLNYNILPPLQIITRSKEILIVDFKVENQEISDLSLTGPANVVFNGEINI
jgi:diaminopimelate epimerase